MSLALGLPRAAPWWDRLEAQEYQRSTLCMDIASILSLSVSTPQFGLKVWSGPQVPWSPRVPGLAPES